MTPNKDFENQHIVDIGTDKISVFASIKKMYEVVLLDTVSYYRTTVAEAEMINSLATTEQEENDAVDSADIAASSLWNFLDGVYK